MKVNVLIPTLNEATQIRDVVLNASAVGKVYVLDSCSTDGTQRLAEEAGAVVVEHKFENYASQKNWGLDNIQFEAEWVLILDADERLTPMLVEEIRRVLAGDPKQNGFYVNRLLVFMGRPMRHGGIYPSWNLRLFRLGRARYEQRTVHEHMVCEEPTGYLRSRLIHIRSETMSQYIAKHIRYADMESDEWVKLRQRTGGGAPEHSLFRDILRYRQWIRRHTWPALPARPFIRFVYMYFVRLGFLDGRAGWHLARLMMSYEYMISLLYRDKCQRLREGVR